METVPILYFVKILSITPSWRSRGSRSGRNKTFSSTSGRGLGLLLPCFHAPSFVSTLLVYCRWVSEDYFFQNLYFIFISSHFRLHVLFPSLYWDSCGTCQNQKSSKKQIRSHFTHDLMSDFSIASHHFKNSYFIEHLFSSSYIELLGASFILRKSFPQVIRKLEYVKLFG